GTLCRDLLGGLASEAPGLFDRTTFVLVEESRALRRDQESRLAAAGLLDRVRFAAWDDLRARGPLTGCLLANEFLDALPVHVVERAGHGLLEIFVAAGPGGERVETTGEPSTPDIARHFERLGVVLAEGQRAEVGLEGLRYVRQTGALLRAGYALIVDYGHE